MKTELVDVKNDVYYVLPRLFWVDSDKEAVCLITKVVNDECKGVTVYASDNSLYDVGDIFDDYSFEEMSPFIGKVVLSDS